MLTKIFQLWLIIYYIVHLTYATSGSLPELGNETHSIISPMQEKLIGLTWLHQLRKANLIGHNPLINAYLTKIGNRLLANTKQQDLNKFNFFLIPQADLNAFAFLGGNIGVFSGLIVATANESELAAVMAHEISHVTQKHFARQILQQKKLAPITMVSAIAMATIGLPDLILPIIGGHLHQTLTFSRSHEQEADHIGIQILTRAKFDPHAMGDLFQRFNNLEKDQKTPSYLLTHPIFTDRITEAYNRTKHKPYQQYVNSQEYEFIKAQLTVELSEDRPKLLNQITKKLATQQYAYLNELILKFQQALILHKLYKNQEALVIMQKLTTNNLDNIVLQMFYLELLAPINPQMATNKLANLLENFPNYLPAVLLYAKSLNKLGLSLKVVELLSPYNQHNLYELIEEPEIYELLISCYQQLKQLDQKLLAQAKLLVLNHELELAEQKLLQALQYAEKSNSNNKTNINNFLKDVKKFSREIEEIRI